MASSDVLHGPYRWILPMVLVLPPSEKLKKRNFMILHGQRFHVYVCLVNRQSLVMHVADQHIFSYGGAQVSAPSPVVNFFVHFQSST